MRFPTGPAVLALTAVILPAPAEAATEPRSPLRVCNHAGYIDEVYADGPSSRHDDLSGSADECTHWKPVLPGRYMVGFHLRSPSRKDLVISARVKRGDKVFYKDVKAFGGGIAVTMPPGEATRVDLFVRRA